MEMNNKIRSNIKKAEARKVRTDVCRGSAASHLPGGCFMGGRQVEKLPGGGFHGGRQAEKLPGGGFH